MVLGAGEGVARAIRATSRKDMGPYSRLERPRVDCGSRRPMSLLDRFRQPAWKSPDPAVRVDAVRQLGHDQADVLVEVARGDADVRRAAVHRLSDVAVLLEIARGDADDDVRAAAGEALARAAMTAREPAE